MYHDNSIGDIKLTLSVVGVILLHQGVSIDHGGLRMFKRSLTQSLAY